MVRNHIPSTALTFVLAILAAGPTWAGGILIYEAGQEGAGLANAGAAVLGTDPSVQMNNPAGISQLSGTQVNANGQLIVGSIRFSRDDDNDFSGGAGGNGLVYLPGTSFFISHEIDEHSSIGFGMYGNFGLALNYDDDWAGRYFTQEAAILGISLQPTYAYKIDDDLSIGIGPRIMYGYYRTEVGINNNLLGLANRDDGQLEFKDTDFGYGVNVGVLYKLNAKTMLGFAYTSKIDLDFEDHPSIDDISNPILNVALNRVGDPRLKLDMQVPQTATISATYDLDAQWKLLGSVNWQDWSEFGKIGVEVDANNSGVDQTVDRQYKDSWHVSAGTQYQMDPKLRWSLGIGYDSSIVEDEDRTVDLPQAASWRFATGINYSLNKELDLHFVYTLIWLGDMDVEQTKSRSGTTLSGTYTNTYLQIFGGGAVWRF